jgi:hypothetical protein
MSQYIKLEIDNFKCDPIGVLGLFVKILLNAQRKKEEIECGRCGNDIDLQPGELLIDIKAKAAAERIPVKTLNRHLGWLEDRELISIRDAGRYSIVTVRHWENFV